MARVVFLGDDFTGASDSLATYARRGWRSRLVLTEQADTTGLDAVGLPSDLRALPPDRALAELDRLWPIIERAGATRLHLKVCSTFDSAPDTGSIGAIARALTERFKPEVTAVIGGQPSLGRYCAFGTLFARGPDGEVHRIDRHPVMAHHPVTPMGEADLRRHLAAQGLDELALIAAPDLYETNAAVAVLGKGPALFDMMREADAPAIARALDMAGGKQLLIGASSVAEILAGPAPAGIIASKAMPPACYLLFAGSRSANTAQQVAAFSGTKTALGPAELSSDGKMTEIAEAAVAGGVLAHLDPAADYAMPPGALADACARFVARVLDRAPVPALGLAGGDTSSRIVQALGFDALDYESSLGAGVAVCTGAHKDPARNGMRIMLKGGQMGQGDLFDAFVGTAS